MLASETAPPEKSLFARYRRVIAPLVLGGGVFVVGSVVMKQMPKETEVEYMLGAEHKTVTLAELEYRDSAHQIVEAVTLRYEEGAPRVIRHTVRLVPGRYDVTVRLDVASGHRVAHGALTVPTEGAVRIDAARGENSP